MNALKLSVGFKDKKELVITFQLHKKHFITANVNVNVQQMYAAFKVIRALKAAESVWGSYYALPISAGLALAPKTKIYRRLEKNYVWI